MTQMSVAPPAMPNLAPASASGAPTAGEAAGAAEGGLDFAAVLKAQIDTPAKDVAAAENLAALLPPTPAGTDPAPAEALPTAPDLSGLLPAIAASLPAPVAPLAGTLAQPADAPALNPAAALPAASQAADLPVAAAALPQSQPVLPTAAAALPASQPGLPSASPAAPLVPAPANLVAGQPVQAAKPPLATAGDPPFQPNPQPTGRPALEVAAPVAQADSRAAAEPRLNAAIDSGLPAPAVEHAAAAPLHVGRAVEAPAASRIDTPVGARGWDAEVGQKVVWMVNRTESRAELTLTPPHMGKVDVTLTMSGDQTNASFVAASPAAREALEQALPRLREILADAGITLGQTSVNAESPRNGREQETLEARGETRRGEVPAAAPQWTRRGNGLVDTFA